MPKGRYLPLDTVYWGAFLHNWKLRWEGTIQSEVVVVARRKILDA